MPVALLAACCAFPAACLPAPMALRPPLADSPCSSQRIAQHLCWVERPLTATACCWQSLAAAGLPAPLGSHQHVGELVVVYVLAATPAKCIGNACCQLVLTLHTHIPDVSLSAQQRSMHMARSSLKHVITLHHHKDARSQRVRHSGRPRQTGTPCKSSNALGTQCTGRPCSCHAPACG